MATENTSPIHKRLFGYCSEVNEETGKTNVDVTSIVQKLILFDAYILMSIRLSEIPQLVRTFGFDGLITLLKSNSLRISCSAIAVAERGNMRPRTKTGKRGQPLPLGVYDLATIRPADNEQYISRCFSDIQPDTGLSTRQFIKLKKVIADNLFNVPDTSGDQTLSQVRQEVTANSPIVKILVAKALQKSPGILASPEDFHLNMRPGNDKVYESETNLGKVFDLDEKTVDGVVSQGLLGLAGLNWRIEQMQLFNALTEFSEEEMPIFGQKLGFLIENLLPQKIESQFQRICTIRGMPTINADNDGHIDANRLLEIRNMKECEEFRSWLQSLQNASDAEIEDKLNNLRTRIGGGLISKPGKIIRFLLPTLIGIYPAIGAAISAALGLLDMFLLERIFPYDGPASFVNQLYPSIFNQDAASEDTASK